MVLKRELGFWDVFCIAAGAMISSGLFILPGLAYGIAGPAVILSYALASLLVIPAMLAKAELATAMPKSGGSYFFIIRSMGAFPGLLSGLASWFSLSLKAAFALIGIGAMFNLVVPDTPPMTIKWVALAGCLVFTALNLVSVKMAGRSQIWMVLGLLAVLVLFVVAGLPHARHPHYADFLGKGPMNILYVAGLVFVSYGGLTKVASVAEEVRDPGRNIPGGMFAAFIVVALLYVAAVFVVVGLLESSEMFTQDAAGPRANLTPLSSAAAKLPGWQGSVGMVVLALAGCLAFFTTANGGILSASRIPMAMARDALLPRRFGQISDRLKTPVAGILTTSGFMVVVILLLDVPLLAKTASTMMLMLFLLVNVAVLILRTSRIQNYRPLFRSPLYPWLQVISIPLYAILIVSMGPVPLTVTGGFCLLGAAWYFLYVRHRIQTESALLFMVRNALSKVMVRSELETELREIAFQRDEVTHDRFDRLIKDCDILDLPEAVTRDELFRRISQVVGERLHLEPERVYQEFQDREKQSSTVIQEGLAIPHIVLEGTDLFEMVVVRCSGGALFPNQQTPVYTVFALVGSPDQRNYHLQALMAIAHIVQEHGFPTRWRKARAQEDLRDVLLLSGRRRHQGGI
jgi:amino acid transporter/mannitol/fructose-specific phosphotransferase system IIA component (Ntr-type)